MKKIQNQIPYLLFMVLSFYGFPLIDRESGMLTLLILFPLVCLLSAFVYGVKYSFSLLLFGDSCLVVSDKRNYTHWVTFICSRWRDFGTVVDC